MKKFLLLAAVASVVTAHAYAEDHDKGKRDFDGKPPCGAYKHHGDRMKKADTDNDGKISKAEFLAEKEKHFAKMDVDGDGFLDREDMKAARKQMKAMHEKMKAERKENGDKEGCGPEGHRPPPPPQDDAEE